MKTIRDITELDSGDFIAVIAARSVLDNIVETKKKIAGRLVTIRAVSYTHLIKWKRDFSEVLKLPNVTLQNLKNSEMCIRDREISFH